MMADRRPKRDAVREMLKMLAMEQTDQERALVAAIVERTEELLCDEPFEVSSNGTFIEIGTAEKGRGNAVVMMQGLMWRAPLDVDERLRMIFESYTTRLQEFISKATGNAWPCPNCERRVVLTTEMISVAWVDMMSGESVCEMRPVSRAEIGQAEADDHEA